MKLPPIVGASGNAAGPDSEAYARQLQDAYDNEPEDDDDEEDDNQQRNRRRGKGKKGRRRARRENSAGGLDFRDNGDIELMQQDFSREHFRKLIKKTFDDYYPLEYNKSTFNMDEYLEVVSKE